MPGFKASPANSRFLTLQPAETCSAFLGLQEGCLVLQHRFLQMLRSGVNVPTNKAQF